MGSNGAGPESNKELAELAARWERECVAIIGYELLFRDAVLYGWHVLPEAIAVDGVRMSWEEVRDAVRQLRAARAELASLRGGAVGRVATPEPWAERMAAALGVK